MKKILLVILFVSVYPLFCFADFTDNGNGTITDNDTGLVWMEATAADTMNWDEALYYCETLVLAEQSDWRLPTYEELQSIVDYDNLNPAINTMYFPDTMSLNYWSSTIYANNNYAWRVSFYNGNVSGFSKSYAYYVRAVRGGQ
jgi:hypothetical protein